MAAIPLKGVRSSLKTASNLGNLLPTGTVLAFEALLPSFSNNGACVLANKYLTLLLIISCALICFFLSFVDSFTGKDGKIYYGLATFKGLYVLNDNDSCDQAGEEELVSRSDLMRKYRIRLTDFVHAFGSVIVFLVFAISDQTVQNCILPKAGHNAKALIMNLPLGAAVLGSFLFMAIPTKRRGLGYADVGSNQSH